MKIALHGCYDIQNFGDILLARMLAARVRETFGTEPVVPMEGRRGQIKWLNDFRKSDYCIWGGGGYLCDHPAWAANVRHYGKYLMPATVMRTTGIPYSLLCPGAGPLASRLGHSTVRYICNGARIIVVRDEESRELVAATGVEKERVQVAADFVLSLDPASIPAYARQKAATLVPTNAGSDIQWVGLHLESMHRENPQECMSAIKALFALARATPQVRFVFVCDHSATLHEHYRHLIKEENGAHIAVPRQDIWVTLALLQSLNAIITSKLHVGIAGYSVGVPVFGLWTHPKTPRFYRMIGREDSQVPAVEWRQVLPAWFARIASPASEAARFQTEFQRKAGFTQSIDSAFARVTADIRSLPQSKSSELAA